MADGTEPVSDGVEPVEAQQVERHGAEPCQHLHPVAFTGSGGRSSRSWVSRTQCQEFSIDHRSRTCCSTAFAVVRRLVSHR